MRDILLSFLNFVPDQKLFRLALRLGGECSEMHRPDCRLSYESFERDSVVTARYVEYSFGQVHDLC